MWKSGTLLASVAAKHEWAAPADASLAFTGGHLTLLKAGRIGDGLISMRPRRKEDNVLEKAIGGIPRVARIIVAMHPDERRKALQALEYSYRITALNLGFGEGQARGWATVVMMSLQAEVQEALGR